MGKSALKVEYVCKRFGGFQAIDRLSLDVKSGELRCIIGPNGAGKTTLFNLITGKIRPDTGCISMEERDITRLEPYQITRLGIARKFQVPGVFEKQTIFENLGIAIRGHESIWSLMFSPWLKGEIKDRAQEILEVVHLSDRGDEIVGTLSHGEKQWLEIGMVLAFRPKIMLLDEPTAGMSPQETMETSRIIKKVADRMTTIVIEHDIKFLKEIAEFVTVLHRGTVLAEGSFDEIEKNELVRSVYLGKKDKDASEN